MRLWLTKLSVVLITFITLGIYIPPTYLDEKAQDQEVTVDQNVNHTLLPLETSISTHTETEHIDVYEQFVSYASEQAKLQSFEKFGPKIADVVGDEFLTAILPKIEAVIRSLANEANENELISFEVSEKPAKGYGEKIFHIYNQQSKEDIARFHVKRVNHPRYGYSFNFHYHLIDDRYEHHHDLGEIYWDKNTPPKWMS